jgi:hypothetical protein
MTGDKGNEEVNKILGEINDITDEAVDGDFEGGVGKYYKGKDNEEMLQNFKDHMEEKLDEIQEDVNAGRIKAADKKARTLRDDLKVMLKKDGKQKQILDKLKAFRKAKRKIVGALVVADQTPTKDQLVFACLAGAAESGLQITSAHPVVSRFLHELGVAPATQPESPPPTRVDRKK